MPKREAASVGGLVIFLLVGAIAPYILIYPTLILAT